MPMQEVSSTRGRTDSMADRVLVADDDPASAALLKRVLTQAGFEVVVVTDGLQAVEWAIRNGPVAVMLSVSLPTIDGYEVLTRLRRDHRTLFTVVIFVTSQSGPGDIVHGWSLEPDDFVVKPFDPDALVARLRARISRVRAALAASWALLPGGVSIETRIRDLIRRHEGFALLYVDIDRFKAFNDRYSWIRGNRAIEMLARVLRSVANDVDADAFAGHVGGDDFVMIVRPELAEKAATDVIARFDRAAPRLYDPADRRAGFVEVQDRRRKLERYPIMTLSIGIATTATRRFGHFGAVAAVAAEMKQVAKRDEFSSYAIDRRSGNSDPPRT
jgi:diguanylate cyclase (GGDEF)-like protein